MRLSNLRDHWERFGEQDPMWAILTRREAKGNRWDVEEFFRTGDEEIQRTFVHLEKIDLLPRSGAALDFGCGVGRLSQALAKRFESVHGVDIADSMLSRARDLDQSGGRCEFHHNTNSDLRLFDADSFDFIYTNIVLQHIRPDYVARYLEEFVRVLRPAGVLVFQMTAQKLVTAADRRFFKRAERAWKRVAPYRVRHPFRRRPRMEIHCFPKAEILALLTPLGIEFVDILQDSSAGPGWQSFRYYCKKPVA
ncbi:MAG: class I SAM-dependent methyltransferase [Planctomycetota bacterium]|nr:class I SAM-dependent methyltransferase [Planctomycetota bacterium]